MALSTMYPAKPGSPSTSLTSGIAADATSMTLDDASVLPAAPNICVLGSDSSAEIVSYTNITGNVVSGLVRGLGGTTASAWQSNTAVARNITSLDHDTFIGNINDLNTNKANLASPAFTGAPTAPTASSGTKTTQLATTEFLNNEIVAKHLGMFFSECVISGDSTSISSNSDLNSLPFTATGKFVCTTNAIASSLSNCPTNSAFSMLVFNLMNSSSGVIKTNLYDYRTRIIMNYIGSIFISYVTTDANGNASYSTWKQIQMS